MSRHGRRERTNGLLARLFEKPIDFLRWLAAHGKAPPNLSEEFTREAVERWRRHRNRLKRERRALR